MRTIPSKILTADQLGLPEAVKRFCMLTRGLVLVTGPTGSGKSTTLAAMVDLINDTRADHILTIEDPIEFVHQKRSAWSTSVRSAPTPRASRTPCGRRSARTRT